MDAPRLISESLLETRKKMNSKVEGLSNGTHTITIVSTDGQYTGEFKVYRPVSPEEVEPDSEHPLTPPNGGQPGTMPSYVGPDDDYWYEKVTIDFF